MMIALDIRCTQYLKSKYIRILSHTMWIVPSVRLVREADAVR
jgi:hypothetical protein